MPENVTEVKGHFPFYRRFRKFGNGGEWNKYFSRKFPESPIIVEFPTESSEKYASKVEKKENFRNEIFENFGIPHEVIFFLEFSENDVPFATGRFG